MPVKECDEVYRKLGSDVFKQNVIVGTMKMGWNHAFYDTEAWENVLKSVDVSFQTVLLIPENNIIFLFCTETKWVLTYWLKLREIPSALR